MVQVHTIKVFGTAGASVQRHDWTYYEIEIPSELEEKISSLVEPLLEEFYSKCQCESCRNERELKQLPSSEKEKPL